uniref:Uncharacterized protein n=1 Tax=Rhipicephalus zambeziensis TaxID=60191 RepID=A0A224YIT3_9ACAR
MRPHWHFLALVCYGFLNGGKRVIMYSCFDITGTLVVYSCKYFSLLGIHVPAQAVANCTKLSAAANANSHAKQPLVIHSCPSQEKLSQANIMAKLASFKEEHIVDLH